MACDLIVVGGGAAGFAAAIAAARRGEAVTVLERNGKALKKLGVTGNGRGNLLNAGAPVYYGNAAFAEAVLARIPFARLCAFWEELGVPLREEGEGRVYPASLQAALAAEALRLAAQRLGVRVCCRTRVTGLSYQGNGFVAEAEESPPPASGKGNASGKPGERAQTKVLRRVYKARRVLVAPGGAAAPAHGTDGTAYGLLTGFGHTLSPIRPALCALTTETAPMAGLAGQRVRARLALVKGGGASRVLHAAAGEALFAADGVSGIAAMQLARFAEPGCLLRMDLRPTLAGEALNREALAFRLKALALSREGLPLRELFTGQLARPLSLALLKAAGITGPERPMEALAERDFSALAHVLSGFTLTVTGTRGFEGAQVTAGGISSREFSPDSMESRLCPGLFAAGEVLDVDGDCGGFNLMFAVAGGILAGQGAG